MAVRSSREYDAWRTAVFERDGHKCQMPGCRVHSKRLEAHHIRLYSKHPTIRLDVDNGITLCHICHNWVRGEEKRYAALFLKIVAQNSEN
jgi:5-methylcytosine-specific restriction endonuclease McrA